jgi:hypothetical protein
MLSDILFETIEGSESYERELPQVSGDTVTKQKLQHVKDMMRAMMRELDSLNFERPKAVALPKGNKTRPRTHGLSIRSGR